MRDASKLLKGDAILDAPERVPAVWGSGDQVLWAEGEPLILAGPPGVGKSSIAQQVALARAGISADMNVLGHFVMPGEGRTLYVAADRPFQIMRSMRRMVEPRHRRLLEEGSLLIWPGPFDLDDPDESLFEFCWAEGIGTVVLDSIKDVAGDTSDGKVGAAFNRTLQSLVSEGVEVMALHHNRKAQDGNRKPKRLDDLYGSTWIAAGAGSVLYLYGEAGDPVVELLHLKQPVQTVGPLTVVHDHASGTSTASGGDVWELIERAPDGVTVKEAAVAMFASSEPSRVEIEKARRRLDRLARSGKVVKVEGDGEKAPATYRQAEVTPESVITRDRSRDRSRADHGEAENGLSKHHAAIMPDHAPRSSAPDPPPTGEGADRDRDVESLEDCLLDDERAEEIRAAVDGEWMDGDPAGSIVWDYTGGAS